MTDKSAEVDKKNSNYFKSLMPILESSDPVVRKTGIKTIAKLSA